MTITIQRNQLCYNPEVARQEDVSLPKVNNITSPFWWTPIADLMGCNSVDFGRGGMTQENLDDKREHNGYKELSESIKTEGIFNPVYWDGYEFGNGHHRLAVCIDLGYTHIPTTANSMVEWDESGITTSH